MVAFVSERTGHAAATGIEHLGIHSHRIEELLSRLHSHQRLSMAMTVHNRATFQSRRMIPDALEIFIEKERLLGEPPGIFTTWKEIQ